MAASQVGEARRVPCGESQQRLQRIAVRPAVQPDIRGTVETSCECRAWRTPSSVSGDEGDKGDNLRSSSGSQKVRVRVALEAKLTSICLWTELASLSVQCCDDRARARHVHAAPHRRTFCEHDADCLHERGCHRVQPIDEAAGRVSRPAAEFRLTDRRGSENEGLVHLCLRPAHRSRVASLPRSGCPGWCQQAIRLCPVVV